MLLASAHLPRHAVAVPYLQGVDGGGERPKLRTLSPSGGIQVKAAALWCKVTALRAGAPHEYSIVEGAVAEAADVLPLVVPILWVVLHGPNIIPRVAKELAQFRASLDGSLQSLRGIQWSLLLPAFVSSHDAEVMADPVGRPARKRDG